MPAAVFGTLARLGLDALTSYPGESIFPLAYVQGVGCLIMGFCLALKQPISDFYSPLYIAFTTGFCGSLTTFSGWQFDIFNSWTNPLLFHRDWLRDVIDGITKTVFTLIISLASVSFGEYLAAISLPFIPTLGPPRRAFRYGLCTLGLFIYAATFPAYARLPTSYRSQATAALMFSFPGALTRYLLSIYINPMLKLLPLGTLLANIVGTGLLGMFHILQGVRTPFGSHACSLLQGLSDGYCGTLTTVSTFAVEVKGMKGSRRAWLYVLLSLVCSQLLLLVILVPSYTAGRVSKTNACKFV